MPFTHRVAMVTGAASGIGRAAAGLLVGRGAAVVAVDVNSEGLAGLAASLPERLVPVTADVSRPGDVARAVAAAVDSFGGLDVALNSAGLLQPPDTLEELSEEWFDRLVAVNLKGVFLCLKHQIPAMRARGGGAIVNVASVAALGGSKGLGAYCATKHGVLGLTRSAALEAAGHGIRVNALCPGVVDTPMLAGVPEEKRPALEEAHPLGRLATAEEVAEAALWLLSPAASFITGAALPVDGGFTAS